MKDGMYQKLTQKYDDLEDKSIMQKKQVMEFEKAVGRLKADLKDITDKEAKNAAQVKKLSKSNMELENVIQ